MTIIQAFTIGALTGAGSMFLFCVIWAIRAMSPGEPSNDHKLPDRRT